LTKNNIILAASSSAAAAAATAANPRNPSGVITAGNASQVSDGAAAVLVCNEQGLKKLGSQAVIRVEQFVKIHDQ
jgi:acetyl-CoA C-acetyltransferase